MTILMLSPRYTIDSRSLANAAREAGWQVERRTNHQIPLDINLEELILYGESYFVEYFAQELGLFLEIPEPDFLATLPYEMVKRDITFIHAGDFTAISSPMFIKSADIKSIQARVYQPSEQIPGLIGSPDDAPMLLSEPVKWELEYRCFIRDRQLQAISIYLDHGELSKNNSGEWISDPQNDNEAEEFIIEVLGKDDVNLPHAVVVDVGKIEGRGWSIIELNPAWSSGIYGCNPEGVLHTLLGAMRIENK